MTDQTTPAPFQQWAIVEIMGRQAVAGKLTEQTIAGAGFLRIDVPQTSTQQAWSRLISPQAIYAITPVPEDIATARAESLCVRPLTEWDLPTEMREQLRIGRQQLDAGPADESADAPRDTSMWDEDEDD